jgi:hypothetical protein
MLQFRKMSAKLVPRQLTPELKQWFVDACQELCGALKQKVMLLSQNYYWRWNLGSLPPAGNQESEQGMAPSLLTKTEVVQRVPICRKSYADCLSGWTRRNFGVLHDQGDTVASATCIIFGPQWNPNDVDFWVQMFVATWQCRPHTARVTVATIEDPHFECLSHPQYSPDLTPSDYHITGPLKEAMGGKIFRFEEKVLKWRMCGCARDQNNFFLEESMHFVSAGGLVPNSMETT